MSYRSTFAESDVDSEKNTTIDNETAAKKLAIRQPLETALKYRHKPSCSSAKTIS